MNKRTETRQHSIAAPPGHSRKGKTTRRATEAARRLPLKEKESRIVAARSKSMEAPRKLKRENGRPKEGGIKEPIFGSMKSCSGVTGIPQALLSLAKDKGCPAFKLSRVYLFEFLRWQYSQDGDTTDWDSLYKEYRAKREKQAYEKEDGRTIDKDEVVRDGNQCISELISTLDRKFKVELPPDLAGRTPADISAKLMAALQECWVSLRKRWSKSTREPKEL